MGLVHKCTLHFEKSYTARNITPEFSVLRLLQLARTKIYHLQPTKNGLRIAQVKERTENLLYGSLFWIVLAYRKCCAASKQVTLTIKFLRISWTHLSNSKGWRNVLNMRWISDFERKTAGSLIQRLNHKVVTPFRLTLKTNKSGNKNYILLSKCLQASDQKNRSNKSKNYILK